MALTHRLCTCWLCDQPMNESNEHVLPESITYRSSLRVRGFICERCNNQTGTEWDVALAIACQHKFRADSNYLPNIRTSGPRRPPAEFITNSGEIIEGNVDHEGNFQEKRSRPEQVDMGDGYAVVTIQGSVEDKKILEQRDSVMKGFDSVISVTSQEEIVHGRVSQEIQVSHGKIRRSLVKSYMALAYYLGIDPNMCDASVPYLRGETADCLLQEPPIFIFREPALRYKHIAMVYSMSNFLLGGAHISGYPLELLRSSKLRNELHVETLVPALLSRKYVGPPIMKAYVVDVRHKQYRILDIGRLLEDSTVKFNPRQLSDP